MVAVGNLGNLLGTAPLALSVAAIGWRSSFFAIGITQILVTLLVFGMVRDKPAEAINPAAPSDDTKSGMLSAWGIILGNRDFWLLGVIAFAWYGNYLALQGLWGGPYLMEVLHLSREATGRMLMFTSLGFIAGSTVTDTVARRLFRSYKKTLLAGQLSLVLLMTGFQGWMDGLPQPLLMALFFAIGLAVSSGVMIYPIIRVMFPVRIVGTALTSLNFFVLMGAASTQQLMGIIIGFKQRSGIPTAQAFHSAFLLPFICLSLAIILFLGARDYTER
jgi:sugar phosphate permease